MADPENSVAVLVDDDPAFAGEVASALRFGGGFVWVDRSLPALDVIRAARPDLILVDIGLPRQLAELSEEEGIEIVARLDPAQRERVIVVTRTLSARVYFRLAKLGVTRFYLKADPLASLRQMAVAFLSGDDRK